VYAVTSFESAPRLALRPAGRTLATQFREKQKQFIDSKCCAMTSYFDELTIEYVKLTRIRKNGVNAPL
jgi:hypothetical protein